MTYRTNKLPANTTLTTARLRLGHWREEDLTAFAAMNADPRVMEFMPKLLSRAQSDALAERISQNFAIHGFGGWTIEVPGVADFIGFAGLSVPRFEAHFTPCVEIGWRLAYDFWGFGYATEAARAALEYGFQEIGLQEIVSFTTTKNQRSRRVMERLGMKRSEQDDFLHPLLEESHPLRAHVLYRMRRPDPA
jgi:RimJ/RimL family protein N-acetyltransferase